MKKYIMIGAGLYIGRLLARSTIAVAGQAVCTLLKPAAHKLVCCCRENYPVLYDCFGKQIIRNYKKLGI